MGQASHIGLEILHALDEIPVHNLDIPHLYTSIKTPEESCAQVTKDCVIFLQNITD